MLRRLRSILKSKPRAARNLSAPDLSPSPILAKLPALAPPLSKPVPANPEDLLLECVSNRNIKLAANLLDQGISTEVKSVVGNTCLHLAIYYEDIKSVKFFLLRHANVNSTNKNGASALHYAIEHKVKDILRAVLDQKPNLELLNKKECDYKPSGSLFLTPLMSAVNFDNVYAITMLVKQGAKLNIADIDGWTALHLAVYSRNQNAVNELLQLGADQTLKTRKGNTARQFATIYYVPEVFNIFKMYDFKSFSYRLKKSNYQAEIPEHLKCIFTFGIIDDPITVSSGITYDREQLALYHASLAGNPQKFSCPITKKLLNVTELKTETNFTIKKLLEEFVVTKEKHCHDVKLFANSAQNVITKRNSMPEVVRPKLI